MSSTVFDDFVRIGNIGVQLIVNMTEIVNGVEQALDLNALGLQSSTIELRKPRGTITSVASSILNPPGTDGKIHHIDSVGIFDRRGRWQLRGRIVLTNNNVFKGSWSGFTVGE